MPEPSDRDGRPPPDWPVCSRHDDEGCIGVRIGTTAYCLAHLEDQDPEELKAFLTSLGPGASLDLRGTQLSSELLERVLAPLRTDEEQGPTIGDAGFEGAQFSGPAEFRGAQFSGFAGFGGAQFSGPAVFDGVEFSGPAGFTEAQFSGPAAMFQGVQFRMDAGFEGAQFSGDAGFEGVEFSGAADFAGAKFITTAVLGPLRAERLVLDGASFGVSVVVEVAARCLSMVETRFEQEATLWLRYADVLLDRAAFAKPSSLAFAEEPFLPSPTPTHEQQEPLPAQGPTLDEAPFKQADSPPRPRLLSLRRVDATNLVLADLDLSWCLFRGAHNLDKLRVEGPKHFATTPKGRRWTQRRTLAEEQQWRHTRHPGQGWAPPSDQALEWVAEQSGQPVQQAEAV
jgi:uncharacterized protein YjbI with pentapeptide repeats